MRFVRASISAWDAEEGRGGVAWESNGRIVTPLWPPTTGTVTVGAEEGDPASVARKVDARTTSRVVTPNNLGCVCKRRVQVRSRELNHKVDGGGSAYAPFWIKNVVLFEYLGNDWHCAIHGVWGHALWGKLRCGMGENILEMTRTNALGAFVAIPIARSRMMPALIYAESE